jgi:hypothetical protein
MLIGLKDGKSFIYLLIKGSSYIAHKLPLCLCGTSKNASCISLHFAYVAYFREVFPLYIDDIDVSQFIFFSIHTKL